MERTAQISTLVFCSQVCQPFDGSKFNFKKAFLHEVLFLFQPAAPSAATATLSAAAATAPPSSSSAPLPPPSSSPPSPPGESHIVESAVCGASPNLVLINVSPIEYGHVLLVPRVMDDLPQVSAGFILTSIHIFHVAHRVWPCAARAPSDGRPATCQRASMLGSYCFVSTHFTSRPHPSWRPPCHPGGRHHDPADERSMVMTLLTLISRVMMTPIRMTIRE